MQCALVCMSDLTHIFGGGGGVLSRLKSRLCRDQCCLRHPHAILRHTRIVVDADQMSPHPADHIGDHLRRQGLVLHDQAHQAMNDSVHLAWLASVLQHGGVGPPHHKLHTVCMQITAALAHGTCGSTAMPCGTAKHWLTACTALTMLAMASCRTRPTFPELLAEVVEAAVQT